MIPSAPTVSSLILMLAIVLCAGIVASCQHPDFQEIQTVPLLISPKDNETVYDSVITFSWQHDTQGQDGLVYELWVDGEMVAEVEGNAKDTYQTTMDLSAKKECTPLYWMVRTYNKYQIQSSDLRCFELFWNPSIPIVPLEKQTYSCNDIISFSWQPSICYDGYILQITSADGNIIVETEVLTKNAYSTAVKDFGSYNWQVIGIHHGSHRVVSGQGSFEINSCTCEYSELMTHEYDLQPSDRAEAAFIYDPTNNLFYLHGGDFGEQETWILDPKKDIWKEVTKDVGKPVRGTYLTTGDHLQAVVDGTRQQMLLGSNAGIYALPLNPLGTWYLMIDFAEFSDQLKDNMGKTAASDFSIGYEEKSQTILYIPDCAKKYVVCQFDVLKNQWQTELYDYTIDEGTPKGANLIFYPKIDQFVLLFGCIRIFQNGSLTRIPDNKIKTFNQKTLQWNTIDTIEANSSTPHLRSDAGAIYDACSETILFFAGWDEEKGECIHDMSLWSLNILGEEVNWKRINLVDNSEGGLSYCAPSINVSTDGMVFILEFKYYENKYRMYSSSFNIFK